MSQFDSNKDYYGVLGVDKDASQVEIDRQYKRQASKHHPDRGGSEERMKSLNEAYGVLKDKTLRILTMQAGVDLTRSGFYSGHEADGSGRRSDGSLPERAALFDRRLVFAVAGAVSMDLVSLAAR
jgi:DnaJ-class molecular chaperone